MTYRTAILQRVTDRQKKAYADKHISFAAVQRKFGANKEAAAEYVANQARMMMNAIDCPYCNSVVAAAKSFGTPDYTLECICGRTISAEPVSD